MIDPAHLKGALCSTFCAGFDVRAVPAGLSVSSIFTDNSGDPFEVFVIATHEGYRIEDDGSYLPHLTASGIDIDRGQRASLLDAILESAQAFWDRDTFEIKTQSLPENEIPKRVADFLSALIRVRDLELLTKEVTRSTFREDALRAMTQRFADVASIEENTHVQREFSEFPSDIVLRPTKHGRAGAIYLVSTNEKLSEALLLQQETRLKKRNDFAVIALIEEPDMKQISRRNFQRAQNRFGDANIPWR